MPAKKKQSSFDTYHRVFRKNGTPLPPLGGVFVEARKEHNGVGFWHIDYARRVAEMFPDATVDPVAMELVLDEEARMARVHGKKA